MAIDTPNRIKELREARGWTQRELADRAAVTDQTISNLERGQQPTLATALAVAGAFGEPVEGIFVPGSSTTSVEAADVEVIDADSGASAAVSAPSGPLGDGARPEVVGNSEPVR